MNCCSQYFIFDFGKSMSLYSLVMPLTWPQFHESIIICPWKCWHRVLRHAPVFTRSHPVHSQPHQHFSPNTIPIVACGENKPNHSDLALSSNDTLPKLALIWTSRKTHRSILTIDGLFFKTCTGFIPISQHLPSASYEYERKLYPLIVTDCCCYCYKVISLKPSAGLSWGLGTFLAAFFISEKKKMASSVCRL